MRSWNIYLHDLNPLSSFLVRNLPMRSWNFIQLICADFWHNCSQFTNEELKHFFLKFFTFSKKSFAIYQWGVETLFNLFKYVSHKMFAIYQWGVETVIFSHSLSKVRVQFAIYQWGVETVSFSLSCWITWLVRNLPMRSWNVFQISHRRSKSKSSQFTNEELKQ